jgi:hypothetical protein
MADGNPFRRRRHYLLPRPLFWRCGISTVGTIPVEARWECPVGPTRPGLSQAALPSEVPLPLEPDRKAEIEMVVASLQSLPVNRPAG